MLGAHRALPLVRFPSQRPHRLDLLWRGFALPTEALQPGLRRLRPGHGSWVALGRVLSLVLDVDRVCGTDPGGSVLDAAVPRWPPAVSSLANRSVGGHLGSRIGSAR